jgi:hypothetical protein
MIVLCKNQFGENASHAFRASCRGGLGVRPSPFHDKALLECHVGLAPATDCGVTSEVDSTCAFCHD